MDTKAKIYTYTIVRSASEDFVDKVPYAIAVLEDQNGKKFSSRIEGYKENMNVAVGHEVSFLEFDQAGSPIYKF